MAGAHGGRARIAPQGVATVSARGFPADYLLSTRFSGLIYAAMGRNTSLVEYELLMFLLGRYS